MEKVALNNVQLDRLADSQPTLKPYFDGTVPCNRLPSSPDKKGPVAYIVNTDQEGQPGRHWLALWTCDDKCEVLDSYALPLETYQTTQPLQRWLDQHWKIVIQSSQSLQSLYSRSCGDYALFFLVDRSQGKSMNEFLREAVRIFRESKISDKKSKFFLFCQNIPFCELVSKKIFLSSSDFFSG